jgi:SAM-dependent methyltransferase
MQNGRDPLAPVFSVLRDLDGTPPWLRCTLGQPSGVNAGWHKLVAQPIALASGTAVKLVFSCDGAHTTRTVPASDWDGELDALLEQDPHRIDLAGRDNDYHARLSKSGRWMVSRGKPSLAPAQQPAALPGHDRERNHPLPPGDEDVRQLFIETGLFALNGQLRGSANGKYRQVQHYLELLRPLAVLSREAGAAGEPLRIVDAGCGKAYLSLGLYLYAKRLGFNVTLTGIDRNAHLVAQVREIAQRLGFEGASFEGATIEEVAAAGGSADLLVSLHACDTATDDAIAAGLALQAKAIVLAPCCHHEVVHQLDVAVRNGNTPAGLEAITALPVLRRRFAELVTDGLRAAALEARGYRAEMLEFTSPEHTLRNLMIRAEQRPAGAALEPAMAAGYAAFESLRSQWALSPSIAAVVPAPG